MRRRRKQQPRGRRGKRIATVVAGLLLLWWLSGAARVYPWSSGARPTTWSVRNNYIQANGRAPQHRWIAGSKISPHLRAAAVAGEDVGFFWHRGFAFADMWLAVQKAVQTGELRGASTITQQLAKNLFWSRQRSWLRKLDELVLVFWLELWLSKREILDLYLNVIEFGPGVFGAEAAARHYFGVSAANLSRAQAISLAAGIPSPRRANFSTQTKSYNIRRRAIVARLARMPQIERAAR